MTQKIKISSFLRNYEFTIHYGEIKTWVKHEGVVFKGENYNPLW